VVVNTAGIYATIHKLLHIAVAFATTTVHPFVQNKTSVDGSMKGLLVGMRATIDDLVHRSILINHPWSSFHLTN
jgi:hypothetical protein